MNNLKCPNCGGKLDKSSRGEYIYTCPYCKCDVDIQSHLSIDLDSKNRFCKAAYTHIQNGNLGYASEMLNRLELEYPFDKEVQDLRIMYDAACEEENYRQEKEKTIRRISSFEGDSGFWNPHNGFIDDNYQNKLKTAIELLDKAEEYKIECQQFRARMWKLFDDVRKGKLNFYRNEQVPNAHKYYNMFLKAKSIYDDVVELQGTVSELQKKEKELNDSHSEWENSMNKKFNQRYCLGVLFCICSVVLFFIGTSSYSGFGIELKSFSRVFCVFMGVLGTFMLFIAYLSISLYKSKKRAIRRLSIQTAMREDDENEKREKINEIKEETNKAEEKIKDEYKIFNDIANEYRNITFNKAADWISEHKDLFEESKGE